MKSGTYILFSLKDKRTYVGSTNNLDRRLFEHQEGKVSATKNRLPIKLIYFEEYESIDQARKREHYYKSCAGRKKLKVMLNKIIKI